jgi:hypothetical protein
VGCIEESLICTRETFSLSVCICELFLDNPCTQRADLFKGVCPSKKQKEMKKGKLGMQEGVVCTYFIQVEVCFVH